MKFCDSSQTYCLKQSEIFISSFPGKIVFGLVNQNGYKKQKYFEFGSYFFFNFYLSVVKIVEFFATDLKTEDKGLITSQTETSYYWIGKSVVQDKKSTKVIKLGIESLKTDGGFEIVFNINQFNEFVKLFYKLIFPCLCLKTFERELFESVSLKSLSFVINLDKVETCKSYLKTFEKAKNIKIDSVEELNLVDLLIYYNELIILYKKLKSLYNPTNPLEENRLEAILNS
jgi:hypothetical protein